LLRGADGTCQLSDQLLGPGLTCIGFGRSTEPYIGTNVADAWRARGGSMVHIRARGEPTQEARAPAYEDLDRVFSRYVRSGWMAVVRPDGVLLHDGPLRAASRVLRESLSLLDHYSAAHS
jgi:3-(3-hydroxy-phenyl)propionate hydroxylase